MLSSLANSLSAVLVILILTGIGYWLSALGWIKPEAKAFLSKFIMRFAVPVLVVYRLRNNLTMELLKSSWRMLLIPCICSVLLFSGAWIIGKQLLDLPPKKLSVFMMMCSSSNAMFIGYAMCLELFGEKCTPYVMIYYLVNTSFSQFFGVTGIRRSGEQNIQTRSSVLKSFLMTPSVVAVLVGVVIVLIDWQPPSFLMSCAKYVSNTVSPLALLLAGHIIHEIGLRHLRVNLTMGSMLVFRFVAAPALCIGLCSLLGVDGLARSALVVQTAMPVQTQSVVAAAEYGADENLAAQGIALSTLACFVVIPILMLIL
jgi:predicted permease